MRIDAVPLRRSEAFEEGRRHQGSGSRSSARSQEGQGPGHQAAPVAAFADVAPKAKAAKAKAPKAEVVDDILAISGIPDPC